MSLDVEQLRSLLAGEQRIIEHRGSRLTDHVFLAFLALVGHLYVSIPLRIYLPRRDTITTSVLSMPMIAPRHKRRGRRDTLRHRRRDKAPDAYASRIEGRDCGRPRPRASPPSARGAGPAPRVSSLISALAESATTAICVNRSFSRELCGLREDFSATLNGRPLFAGAICTPRHPTPGIERCRIRSRGPGQIGIALPISAWSSLRHSDHRGRAGLTFVRNLTRVVTPVGG
jgi:hypothetical protein